MGCKNYGSSQLAGEDCARDWHFNMNFFACFFCEQPDFAIFFCTVFRGDVSKGLWKLERLENSSFLVQEITVISWTSQKHFTRCPKELLIVGN